MDHAVRRTAVDDQAASTMLHFVFQKIRAQDVDERVLFIAAHIQLPMQNCGGARTPSGDETKPLAAGLTNAEQISVGQPA